MSKFTRVAVWGVAFSLLGCGGEATGSDPTDNPVAEPTAQALCAGAATPRSSNIVTTIACPFEQQYANIMAYGDEMQSPAIRDADGRLLGTVNRSCDSWWLVTDPNGVDVMIDLESGKVRSHGMQHPGQSLSELPDQLALPLTTQEN